MKKQNTFLGRQWRIESGGSNSRSADAYVNKAMMFNWKTPFIIIAFTFILFSLSACTTVNFTEPVASFQQSVDKTGVIVGTYYSELNDFERSIYLEERVLNPELDVLLKDKEKPTPLHWTVFSPESIKARLDAISLLGVYGRRLSELAGSDAPTRFSDASQVLGKNLGELADTFKELGDEGNDSTASGYFGPIGTIIGVFGEMIFEAERDKALEAAIKKGAPAVRNALDKLENDLKSIVQPLRDTGTHQILSGRVNYYNIHREEFDLTERRQFIYDIQNSVIQYDIALSFNPSDLIRGMKEAHEALVKFAESDRQPQNLAEVVSAMSVFENRVGQIAAAMDQLRKLRKGGKS